MAELVIPSASSTMLRPVADIKAYGEYRSEVRKAIRSTLVPKKDFDRLPGTDREVLLKPGAEAICSLFGLVQDPEILEFECDHAFLNRGKIVKWVPQQKPADADQRKAAGIGRNKKFTKGGVDEWVWQEAVTEEFEAHGLYRYVIKMRLVHAQTGAVIGTGVGSASSLESKYARTPHDAENTVLKMAKKRALVDAVLSTFGMSDEFTQDVEDEHEGDAPREPQQQQPAPPAPPAVVPHVVAGEWMRAHGGTKEQWLELMKVENVYERINALIEAGAKDAAEVCSKLVGEPKVAGDATSDPAPPESSSAPTAPDASGEPCEEIVGAPDPFSDAPVPEGFRPVATLKKVETERLIQMLGAVNRTLEEAILQAGINTNSQTVGYREVLAVAKGWGEKSNES